MTFGKGMNRKLSALFMVVLFVFVTGCFKINDAPNGKTGEPYAVKITEGGIGDFVGFQKTKTTITGGSLPAGLEMGDDGYIKGVITDPEGVYNFTILFVDQTLPLLRRSKQVSITVDNSPYKWTILCHFAADNNLDGAGFPMLYLMDLQLIKKNDMKNQIRILLMTDYNSEEDDYLTDGFYYISGLYLNTYNIDKSMQIVETGEINSGDVQYTKDFIDWAFDYPIESEHYMYTVFNHGGGLADSFDNIYANPHGTPDGLPEEGTAAVKGIGMDESHENDSLSHYELAQVTQYLEDKIGRNIDIFYPMACLMGGVELAQQIKDNVDYLLGSEELVLGAMVFPNVFKSEAGPYFNALQEIIDNPDIGPVDLGIAFCNNIIDFIREKIDDVTVIYSMIDLSSFSSLYDAISDYASAAIEDINANDTSGLYNLAADDSLTMAVAVEGENYFYMDLGNYMDNVNMTSGIAQTVKDDADLVLDALDDCVIHTNVMNPPAATNQYYTGFSIFQNIWDSEHHYSVQYYNDLLAFGDNNWADYVELMDDSAPTP